MERPKNEAEFAEVEELIRREEDRALRVFRQTDFAARVKERLQTRSEKKPPSPRIQRVLVPALSFGLLAVVIVAVILTNISKRPSILTAAQVEALLSVLSEAPEIHLSSAPDISSPGDIRPSSSFSSLIAEALTSIEERNEELERPLPPPSWRENTPRFSLRDKMRILYQDRVIERALVLITEKLEEV
jgi:hypothetical protein